MIGRRLLAGLVLALACLCSVPALATASGQMLNGRQQFLNGNGNQGSGFLDPAELYFAVVD